MPAFFLTMIFAPIMVGFGATFPSYSEEHLQRKGAFFMNVPILKLVLFKTISC